MTKSKVQNIVSMREIQRNYKRLFDKVRKTKTPLFLGSYAEPKVVILDVDSFRQLEKKSKNQHKAMNWIKVYKDLERIFPKGRQNVNLAEFIKKDRASR